MEAIEFTTKVKQGKIIEIPNKYLENISGEFRVIILLEKKSKPKKAGKKEFKALKIKTKGLKFNREEIYENE